ncbi:meteorin-like protein isoform X2 [Sagmatias obliquidens]|uniref:meteorin-like protein isoform X2 n=1 Tax=Sagmatias obliquidens TaxID=3371155 RepID=UPI000F44169D|nr:meteorin-like protein isoform X2 [Lagenorhynchus obliquidens]XP_030699188.1 meteorin-like protein isoform X2 [Globicephala melas]
MRGAARAAGGRTGQLWPRPPAPGPGPPPLLLLLAVLLGGAGAQYSSDLCSWKGSGLTHEAHRKEVEQVYLRCSAGTVEWMYPTGALIVNLRPNTFSPSRHLTLCIKPLRGSSGANIYLEKTGELKLLVRDGDLGPGQAPCFSFEQGGLFVEATPQQDISRRTTGFQYELTSRHAGPDLHTLSAPCRPCSHTEVLLAVCTSDFVVRGSIQDVTHEPAQQESAIHLHVSRLYRQKSRVFRPASEGEGGGWRGRVSTLLECGVRPGRALRKQLKCWRNNWHSAP